MSEISNIHNEARDNSFILFSDLSELNDNSKDIIKTIKEEDGGALERLESFSSQIHNIREVLARQQLKVVFFGRTSSGKSSLINALLGDTVLPTGLGHTTRCFIQIQGTDESQPSLMVPLGDTGCFTETPVTCVQDIASALVRLNNEGGHLVILQWPRAQCPLLQVTNQNTP